MRRLSILVLALAFSSIAAADVVHFRSGGKVEGRITNTSVEQVTIETQTAVLTFPREVIAKIERGKSPLDTYREKLAAAKTVEDYQELVAWCETNRFVTTELKVKLRDAVAARRREENPDTYCRECAGYGQVGCRKCRRAESALQDPGTGMAAVPCSQCGGKGTELCTRCSGVGQTPCVRCGSSGVVVLACVVCNGTGFGFCRFCGGRGHVRCPRHRVSGGRCPTCGGTGWTICSWCNMAAQWPCAACGATGQVRAVCPSCQGKRSVGCTSCGRRGLVECSGCRGKATVEVVCEGCQGEGLVGCAACQGTGVGAAKQASAKVPAAR